jgi:hypothetical protein
MIPDLTEERIRLSIGSPCLGVCTHCDLICVGGWLGGAAKAHRTSGGETLGQRPPLPAEAAACDCLADGEVQALQRPGQPPIELLCM